MIGNPMTTGEFNFGLADIEGSDMLFTSNTGHKLRLDALKCRVQLIAPNGESCPIRSLDRPTLIKAQDYLAIWFDEYNAPDEHDADDDFDDFDD